MMKRLTLIFVFLLSWLAAGWAGAQTTLPSGTVAVWYQPVHLMADWKARGITTILGYESEGGSVSLDQFKAGLRANGLTLILQSDQARPQDYTDPVVIGIMLAPDEPDGVGGQSPGQMTDKYLAVKSLTTKPVVLNVDGNKVLWRSVRDYTAYAAACDVLAFDYYPLNYGAGTPDAILPRLQRLKQAAPGKQIVAIAECSDQLIRDQDWTKANDATGTPLGPKMRGPNATEMIKTALLLRAAGVKDIWWFPDIISRGWGGFDGVTPECVGAMIAINLTK